MQALQNCGRSAVQPPGGDWDRTARRTVEPCSPGSSLQENCEVYTVHRREENIDDREVRRPTCNQLKGFLSRTSGSGFVSGQGEDYASVSAMTCSSSTISTRLFSARLTGWPSSKNGCSENEASPHLVAWGRGRGPDCWLGSGCLRFACGFCPPRSRLTRHSARPAHLILCGVHRPDEEFVPSVSLQRRSAYTAKTSSSFCRSIGLER